jgi:hypothetical protein
VNRKPGIEATKKGMVNPESACSRFIGVRGWPPLIKMDAAVKAKVEKPFGNRAAG